ncbi:MAG TPA: FAD-binding protein [Anaerolineales bacterium]
MRCRLDAKNWSGSDGKSQPPFDRIPLLAGFLHFDESSLNAVSDDFGHIRHGKPIAVLEPASDQDIINMVKFARDHHIKIGARGQGHTAFGQSQVEDGILIKMSSLKSSPLIEGNHITVYAGMTWREVLSATLKHGLTPPVLTHNPGLSVGGTLSVGGIDSGSYRYGAQVDNVLELVVVTGEGNLETCSLSRNPDLFHATLAGLGQCAIILKATLRLIPAPVRGRLFRLFYPGLSSAFVDMRQLASDSRFDRFVFHVTPSPIGGWLYFIDAVSYFTPQTLPDNNSLLSNLQFTSKSERTPDFPFIEIVDRVPALRNLEASGRINLPHPWFDIFLPDSNIDLFLNEIFESLTPADIGKDFPISLFPITTMACTRPLFRLPNEPLAFLFDLQSTVSDSGTTSEYLDRNRRLFERARDLGGKLYLIGATPLAGKDWDMHFHPYWDRFVEAKKRFDPDNVLAPGPGIFTTPYSVDMENSNIDQSIEVKR